MAVSLVSEPDTRMPCRCSHSAKPLTPIPPMPIQNTCFAEIVDSTIILINHYFLLKNLSLRDPPTSTHRSFRSSNHNPTNNESHFVRSIKAMQPYLKNLYRWAL